MDLVLLLGASLAGEAVPALITLVLVDVMVGRPDALPRWMAWVLLAGLLSGPPRQWVALVVVGGLLWYGLAGPGWSPWAAGAVVLQSVALLLKWQPIGSDHGVVGQGWGWRRS
jgi:hypothetical protein